MSPIPTGTVCFLFTDLEGSTALWERDRVSMRDAVADHDHLVRRLAEDRRGHVFSTAGDSFAIAFWTPAEAVATAIAAQEQIGTTAPGPEGPLRIRMGVHSGVTDERDGNYFGPALNACARLMECAHGGQILASGTVVDLLRSSEVPSWLQVRDLGTHQLRTMSQRVRVHQLSSPALKQDFPPLRTAVGLRDIPIPLTSFVGRGRELRSVLERLDERRLVTITGPGGAGKTRLAIQAAASAEAFPDGVSFVSFDATERDGDVAEVVGTKLGVRGAESVNPTEAVIRLLSGKRRLLVLDNCEHVADRVATMVETLLSSLPTIAILTTSRERLGVSGESIIDVGAMELPPRSSVRLDEILDSEAGRLLVERLVDTDPVEPPSDRDASALAAICHGLDGLPLALELVASSAHLLTPIQLAQHLDVLLDLGPSRNRDRRSTLRSVIRWSYDALETSEQEHLRRLGVFPGTFDLEAAAAITGVDEPAAIGVLSGFVRKSLLMSLVADGEARYRMLRTIRAFVLDELTAAGDEAGTRLRHARHYASVASRREHQLATGDEVEGLRLIETDYDNFQAAIAHLLDEGDPDTALGMAGALGPFWDAMHWLTEGLHWLRLCLDASSDRAESRAKAWMWLSELLNPVNPSESNEAWARALALARSSGDRSLEAYALAGLARAAPQAEEALGMARAAYAIFEEIGDDRGMGIALHAEGMTHDDHTIVIGYLERSLERLERAGATTKAANVLYFLGRRARMAGRLDDGESWLERSLALTAPLDTSLERAHARYELGHIARLRGEHGAAESVFRECLAQFQEAGDVRCEARMLGALGSVAAARGQSEEATPLLLDSIRTSLQVGAPENLILCLDGLARMATGERAAQLIGAARTARSTLGIALAPQDEAMHDRQVASVMAELGAEVFAAAEAFGRNLTPEEVVAGAVDIR